MKVESTWAQINVRDNDSFAGVNINPAISGYAADMMFWGGAAYLCRRKEDSFLRVLVVPSAKWLQDIKDGGYEVVGLLSELACENAKLRTGIKTALEMHLGRCASSEPFTKEDYRLHACEARDILRSAL